MHNALAVTATLAVLAALAGLVFFIERSNRRCVRPGTCRTCKANPVVPGAAECFECWGGGQQ